MRGRSWYPRVGPLSPRLDSDFDMKLKHLKPVSPLYGNIKLLSQVRWRMGGLWALGSGFLSPILHLQGEVGDVGVLSLSRIHQPGSWAMLAADRAPWR